MIPTYEITAFIDIMKLCVMVKYLRKYLRTIGAFAGHLEEKQWGINVLMLT